MNTNTQILNIAAQYADSGRTFVLVTVATTKGSTPRNCGAKMICLAGSEILGTIGGGELEHLARDTAIDVLEKGESRVEQYMLSTDADQCCGGTVDLLFEYFGARQRVVLFGAGHVAQELSRCLEDGPFERIIVDDRAEWLTPDRFPGCRRVPAFEEGVQLALETPDSTLICVLTCSHDRDFEILRGVLSNPPAFVGLIGSKSKRACFFTRLAGAGVEQRVIDRIHCPIGLGDMGKAPGMVAVSIAGQLLLEGQNLAKL